MEHTIINEEHVVQVPTEAIRSKTQQKQELQIFSSVPSTNFISPTIVSPADNIFQVKSNDHTTPVYLITSNDPISLEVSSEFGDLVIDEDYDEDTNVSYAFSICCNSFRAQEYSIFVGQT